MLSYRASLAKADELLGPKSYFQGKEVKQKGGDTPSQGAFPCANIAAT